MKGEGKVVPQREKASLNYCFIIICNDHCRLRDEIPVFDKRYLHEDENCRFRSCMGRESTGACLQKRRKDM